VRARVRGAIGVGGVLKLAHSDKYEAIIHTHVITPIISKIRGERNPFLLYGNTPPLQRLSLPRLLAKL
jgi:hypothetical protein